MSALDLNSNIRVASFDIECTSLDASYGRLVCACIKYHDEDEVRTKSIRSVKQEPALLRWIEKNTADVDVYATWNGKLFDMFYVDGRRMHHGMERVPLKKHVDLLYQARRLRLRGSRLDGVAKDLGFEHQKIDVPAWRWVLAAEGCKESIGLIVEHCEQDVLMTEEAFGRFKHSLQRFTK